MRKLKFRDQAVSHRKKTLAVVLGLGLAFLLAGCTIEAPEADSPPSPSASQEVTEDAQESTPAPEESAETQSSEDLAPGTIRLSFTNWDETPYPDLEIWIRGYGSWFPNSDGDLLENVGPFDLGEPLSGDFFVYPFGRSGVEIPVALNLSEDHISNSPRDMVLVYIEDGILFVSGSPIAEGVEVPLK